MKLAYTISALAILSGGPAHAATEWWILSYGDTDRDQICEASDKSPADVLQSHKAIGDAVDIDKHGNEVDVTYGAESSGDAFTMRFFRDPQSCRDKLPKPIVSPVALTVPLQRLTGKPGAV